MWFVVVVVDLVVCWFVFIDFLIIFFLADDVSLGSMWKKLGQFNQLKNAIN